MREIPRTENACVLRTDYSDPATWRSVRAAILIPIREFRAYVDFISDSQYDQLSTEPLLALLPRGYSHTFIFVVDAFALTHPEHPIAVIDLYTERGRTFRVIPAEMWAIENNLSFANMDFTEFADNVDRHRMLRGFPPG